jgi:hypothetical protein
MNADLFWRVPSHLDLEKLIAEDRPEFLSKKRSNVDNFYYFIDYLLERSLTADLSKTLGYVQVYSNDLQSKMSHGYKNYLNYLKKHHVIQRAPKKYRKGNPKKGIVGRCYSYRLTFPYQNHLDIKLVPIIGEVYKRERKVLIKNLVKNQKLNYKSFPMLTNWFEELEIDSIGCRKWLDKHKDYQLKMTGDIRGYVKGKPMPQMKRLRAIYSIEKILAKNFRFKIDDNVGRFHSNLTNLKSELRNFLTWRGQRLVSVDIKNSQPLLSTMILESRWFSESSVSFTINDFPSIPNPLVSYDNPYGSIASIPVDSPWYFLICNMAEGFLQSIIFQDVIKYKEIVNSGEFYKRMHSEIVKDKKPFNKDDMKEMTFQVLYSDNRFFHQDGSWMDRKTKKRANAKPKRLFEAAFPTVAKVFRAYKKIDNSHLPRLLQQIESTLIIKHIVPRIASERPDLPVFTIHDSVVTTEGNEGYVEQVMREEIERLTHLKPRFRIERWSQEVLKIQ